MNYLLKYHRDGWLCSTKLWKSFADTDFQDLSFYILLIIIQPLRKLLTFDVVLPQQEIAFYDVTRTGELLSRLSEDTQIIKNAATTNLSEAFRNLTTALIGVCFMFSSSWKLTCRYFFMSKGL